MYDLFRLDHSISESLVKACISSSRFLRWLGFVAYVKPGKGFR